MAISMNGRLVVTFDTILDQLSNHESSRLRTPQHSSTAAIDMGINADLHALASNTPRSSNILPNSLDRTNVTASGSAAQCRLLSQTFRSFG